MRVRVNHLYMYSPNGWDVFHPCAGNNLKAGDVVRVINLAGAPKANVAGHCYVGDPETGRFICLLSTGSLTPVKAVRR